METFYPSWKHLFLETFMETFGNTAGSNMLKKQQKKHKANGSMIPCSTICFHPPPVRGGNRKHFGWKHPSFWVFFEGNCSAGKAPQTRSPTLWLAEKQNWRPEMKKFLTRLLDKLRRLRRAKTGEFCPIFGDAWMRRRQ